VGSSKVGSCENERVHVRTGHRSGTPYRPRLYDRAVAEFAPGVELARAFYAEVIAPLLAEIRHSAAFLGSGSDVLGFDTERSTDHAWGPHLQVFVAPDDVERVSALVESELPDEFRGWPTRYGWDAVAVSHHVGVSTLSDWLAEHLGFDPRDGVAVRDWLVTPQQLLLEVTAGAVFHDGLDELEQMRRALAWYPDDVWLWLLACQWQRLDQEEPFVGRTAEVGDELGSRLLTARLVRDIVRLCFLLERRYAPYSKWLGSAFGKLESGPELEGALDRALAAADYPAREQALVEAVELAAARHNALGITAQVDPNVRLFHSRPFRVLGSARFVDACLDRITDKWLRSLPLVGAIDQFADSTDVLSNPAAARRLAAVYQP
jgi:Domain of unknown function (DUF4037)